MYGQLVDLRKKKITPPHVIRTTQYTREQLASGFDEKGRFIGPGDIDRAYRHFWGAEHRQGILLALLRTPRTT